MGFDWINVKSRHYNALRAERCYTAHAWAELILHMDHRKKRPYEVKASITSDSGLVWSSTKEYQNLPQAMATYTKWKEQAEERLTRKPDK